MTYLVTKNIYIFQNIINMPCEFFWLCHMSQSWTIIKNHNGRWKSIFQKKKGLKIFIMSRVKFYRWMTTNDVSMTSCVQLEWSYIVVENELFWLSYNWVVMSYIVYMVNCNSATHVTCSLALTTYKYNELQGQLQNTPFSHSEQLFSNVNIFLW